MKSRSTKSASRPFALRLDAKTRQAIARAAKAAGESESTYVRGAIANRLELASSSSAYDRLKAIGVVGAYKDALSDLATNPKHMEGFGE